ncbi:hypothetical protein [Sporosarcina koreensis]|uniref:hypothetical protein n=1 Tax=Sporosarcina koreensis TaxID=334735 RepID=UPI00075ABA04|nr:hypothetical protein [Sporosarcina koreensis]
MAIVPLKQRVLVHRPATKNEWGETTKLPPIAYKGRADERTEVVKNPQGAEVVSGVQIMFDKLPDVRYDDEIEYTNEIGVTVKRRPVKIEPIRMLNGKPTLTVVYL